MRTRFASLFVGGLVSLGCSTANAGIGAVDIDFAAGVLTLQSDADPVVLSCLTGSVAVGGEIPAAIPPVPCNTVQRVVVDGGAGDNTINLNAMVVADFSVLTQVDLNGGAGDDTITGSFIADTIHGGDDADTLDGNGNPAATTDLVFGDGGADRMIWNPGKADDINDGGPGDDVTIINGAGAAETYAIRPDPLDPARVLLERTAPSAFFVRSVATEQIEVNGNGGNDIIAGAAGLQPLTQLSILGGDGDDTLTGGDGADLLLGGIGNDIIDGSDNPLGTHDVVFAGEGDDTMIWNPGKDDDVNEGQAGNDLAVINGGGAAEVFIISPNGNRVRFERTTSNGNAAPFEVDINDTERLQLNAGAGDDVVTAGALATLIALEINGGDNNDTITGGDGADIIRGDGGNDTLDGNDNPVATVDAVFGGDGDDSMIWNPGKDDDLNEGGAGNDVSVINGGGGSETFLISANGARVRFERTTNNGAAAPFFVDIADTERVQVNGNGGDEVMTGGAGLAALTTLELNGGAGNDSITGGDGADSISGGADNDVLDGGDNPIATVDTVAGGDGDDTMIWNPGKDDDINEGGNGNDTAVINGGGGAEVFTITPNGARVLFQRTTNNGTPLPFFVDIGSTEALRVNGNAGDDRITGSIGLAALIALELNGDGGSDTITGGDGADVIRGGADNDVLQAGENPVATVDQVFGGAGDDTMIWNPGEDDDVNEGEAGIDTTLVNAAGANEVFEIDQLGGRAIVERTVPTRFVVDSAGVEILQVNASGGDDVINTQLMFDVAQSFDGGPASTPAGDQLNVAGFLGDARFSPILTPHFGAVTHAGFEKAEAQRSGGSATAALEGSQEVPPVTTNGSGRGRVVLNAQENEIQVTLAFEALSGNSTLAHIHGPAAPGSNAPPIFDLTGLGGASGDLGPFTFAVTPAQVLQLKSGQWYFNVHSATFGSGEIRGQILPDFVLEAPLEARQVVPDSTSTAFGYGTVTLAGTLDEIIPTVVFSGLVGEANPGVNTFNRIRGPASRLVNGPIIGGLPLPASNLDSAAFVGEPDGINAGQAAQLRDGLWYFEVVSEEFPQGELRGQITGSMFFDNFE
jgi:Ca2+-binding RTX toxin-like protein